MSTAFDSPIGTIKRRLHVARKRLAQQLEEFAGPDGEFLPTAAGPTVRSIRHPRAFTVRPLQVLFFLCKRGGDGQRQPADDKGQAAPPGVIIPSLGFSSSTNA